MDKNKKKGFTLVELIVVLAILAILAAMLVPALTGYIDKANEKKLTAITRQVVAAAQTEISEAYSKHGTFSDLSTSVITSVNGDVVAAKENADGINMTRILELAEILSGEPQKLPGGEYKVTLKNDIIGIVLNYDETGKLSHLILSTSNNVYCEYDGNIGSYTTNKW